MEALNKVFQTIYDILEKLKAFIAEIMAAAGYIEEETTAPQS